MMACLAGPVSIGHQPDSDGSNHVLHACSAASSKRLTRGNNQLDDCVNMQLQQHCHLKMVMKEEQT